MLVPPQNPILRKVDQGAWKVISTTAFDGKAVDHFGHTTLHLSFTEYNSPIFDGLRGGQDSQVFFLESVVSIHDKGVWVGDIDVLAATGSPEIQRLEKPASCGHEAGLKPTRELASVECWDDILDPPREPLVIRANGNWIARLAATAVLVQMRKENKSDFQGYITLCPSSLCWKCISPVGPLSHLHFSRHLPSLSGQTCLF